VADSDQPDYSFGELGKPSNFQRSCNIEDEDDEGEDEVLVLCDVDYLICQGAFFLEPNLSKFRVNFILCPIGASDYFTCCCNVSF
jgi:hypothetical protein